MGIDEDKIEEMLYEGIPKKGISRDFRIRKLPHLVRYFVLGKSTEKTAKDFNISLPYVRRLYSNLRKIENECDNSLRI